MKIACFNCPGYFDYALHDEDEGLRCPHCDAEISMLTQYERSDLHSEDWCRMGSHTNPIPYLATPDTEIKRDPIYFLTERASTPCSSAPRVAFHPQKKGEARRSTNRRTVVEVLADMKVRFKQDGYRWVTTPSRNQLANPHVRRPTSPRHLIRLDEEGIPYGESWCGKISVTENGPLPRFRLTPRRVIKAWCRGCETTAF